MIKLKIDNREIIAEEGMTILETARNAGIDIPEMCNNSESGHFASCMVCLVKEKGSSAMIPSCSSKVREGMDIVTIDTEIEEARKTSLDLLLSEHTGDCEAPCRIACPANMDIPLMNSCLAAGLTDMALETVLNDIVFPSVLGRICPAPCEGACHRKGFDAPVSVCILKRFAGDRGSVKPYQAAMTGRKAAIIGSGIGGLSAAFYLQLKGISSTLFDKNPLPGGALRYEIDDKRLDKKVLDRETDFILSTGVRIVPDTLIDKNRFRELKEEYDAVVVATGNLSAETAGWGLDNDGTRITVSKKAYRTSIPKVFAIGNVIRSTRLAILSAAQGKEVAFSIEQFLNGSEPTGEPKRFNSRIGRLRAKELELYMKNISREERIEPGDSNKGGYTPEEAMREAARCMHCECLKPEDCKLRILAGRYGVSQRRYGFEERKDIKISGEHGLVIYEPGKCIKCGICVRLAARHGEKPGLAYFGRGYDTEITVPFEEELKSAVRKAGTLIAKACPTGALASGVAERGKFLRNRESFPKLLLTMMAAILLSCIQLNGMSALNDWENYRGNERLTGVTKEAIPANPSPLWTFNTGDEIKSSPVTGNSRIVIGAGNGLIYCLDMNGKLLWNYDTGNAIEAPALINNNRVFAGNLEGTLFCLDLMTGDLIWKYHCDNQIMGAPNIWSDGSRNLILVGSYDYHLHAVDANDGSEAWKYELYNYLNSAVAIENDIAVFGGCDGYLHRVNLKNGEPLPLIEIASYVAGSPALENGIAYIGDYDGVFSAVNYLKGEILWTWEDKERQLPFIASPSVYGNRVIIGNRDRFVYCLDKRTGETLWKTNTGSRVDASTLTDGSRVLVANMRGDIMLLDIETGARLWTYETGSPVSGSPAVAENKIFIGDNSGTLWCFGN